MLRACARWSAFALVAASAVVAFAAPANASCDPVHLLLETELAPCCHPPQGDRVSAPRGNCCPVVAERSADPAVEAPGPRLPGPPAAAVVSSQASVAAAVPVEPEPTRRAYEQPPPLASPVDRCDVLRN